MLTIREVQIGDGVRDAQQSTLRGNEGLTNVVSARHAGYGQELPSTYAREHITIVGQTACNGA